MHDPFHVLGLHRGAAAAEVKRAFRKLAMAWHPDRNATREAEERFKHIKAAYELILDPDRLAAWDAEQAASASAAAEAAPATADDGPALAVHLTLEEAAQGCVKALTLDSEIVCLRCAGAGRHEHTHSVACTECGGIGRSRGHGGTGKCSACGGRGYVRMTLCGDCGGSGWVHSTRTLEVRIPPAMLPGERLRLARQNRRRSGGPAGDLYVGITLRPHPLFRLDGRDLECEVPVGIFQLLLGGWLDVPTLAGTQAIALAPYPQHGLDYRVAGRGYPGRHGRGAGDLKLRLKPVYPRHSDDASGKLLARLHKAMLADAEHSAPELAAWAERLRERDSG